MGFRPTMLLYSPLAAAAPAPAPARSPLASLADPSLRPGCCRCGRRKLAAAGVFHLLPTPPTASASRSADPSAVMERVHPARPDWYEEFFAASMDKLMKSYEDEIAGYKKMLFSYLQNGSGKILEFGVGAGPNFKYYPAIADAKVVGVDPNKHMEKYARAAAVAAGIQSTNFSFMKGVGEALPVEDNSIDVVVGTLVLCSVYDVNMTLKEVKRVLKRGGRYLFIEHVAAKDGTFLRFAQGVLDPLQQLLADGCHLTRETGRQIECSGFSNVELSMISVGDSVIGPHVIGVACK